MILLIILTIAFVITLISIFPTIKIARRFTLLDDPRKRPHPGRVLKRIVPRAGGLACFIGIVITIILFIPLEKQIIGLVLGILILLITGLLDDKYQNFSPYIRLLTQFIAAIIIVGTGTTINFITNPLGGIIPLDQTVGNLLTLLWIVWVMNMINWSKGVDGQMPGIVVITALVLGLLSFKLYLDGDPNQLTVTKLAFATAGSALGFLIMNWYPAKIFPGFSGSTIFGFLIATLSILSGAKLATALLTLLVPATDFVYTFFRRILSGKSPVWGDRNHLHHRLLDLGLSHRQITLFYILGSAILGAIALTLDSKGKLFAAVLVATIILGGILWLNFFGDLSERQDPDNG